MNSLNQGNSTLREMLAFFHYNESRRVFVMTEGLNGRELGAFKTLRATREQVTRWNAFVAHREGIAV